MSKRENFYRRDPSKALSGMIGLTLEERGVYNTVLDLLYSTWRPVEDDRRFIANWCGCAVQKVNPIVSRLIEKGRLITFVENGRTYISDEAFETERRVVKGPAGTRSGRGEVGEKSAGVEEKSAGVGQKSALLDTENAENQSDTALEKRREDKSNPPPTPPPGDGVKLSRFSKALAIAADAGCDYADLRRRAHAMQPIVEGRRKSTEPDVDRALSAAIKRGGWPSAIMAALETYYALPASTKEDGQYASGAAVILNRDRWKEFSAAPIDGPGAAPARAFSGPPEVRASLVKATSEAFVTRWIDPYCRWRAEDRALVARNAFVAGEVKKELTDWVRKAAGVGRPVQILVDAANDAKPQPKDDAA